MTTLSFKSSIDTRQINISKFASSSGFHHLPQPRLFFAEATRCVRPGGVMAMVAPWVTPWSDFTCNRLHHELFEPEAPSWELPTTGPLSGANDALPWIIFARDRLKFEQEFFDWWIEQIRPMIPFRYSLTGSVSMRSFSPGWSFEGCGTWKTLSARRAIN
jgi:hypothetical protein